MWVENVVDTKVILTLPQRISVWVSQMKYKYANIDVDKVTLHWIYHQYAKKTKQRKWVWFINVLFETKLYMAINERIRWISMEKVHNALLKILNKKYWFDDAVIRRICFALVYIYILDISLT